MKWKLKQRGINRKTDQSEEHNLWVRQQELWNYPVRGGQIKRTKKEERKRKRSMIPSKETIVNH